LSRGIIALIVFLAVLAVVAGLYAAGPKYKVYCDPGHTLRHSSTPFRSINFCQSKYGGPDRGTRIRRTSAWERVWYSLVGSKDTRG
jgi:hypothetical protein